MIYTTIIFKCISNIPNQEFINNLIINKVKPVYALILINLEFMEVSIVALYFQ